jgi:hypothetical protein
LNEPIGIDRELNFESISRTDQQQTPKGGEKSKREKEDSERLGARNLLFLRPGWTER